MLLTVQRKLLFQKTQDDSEIKSNLGDLDSDCLEVVEIT